MNHRRLLKYSVRIGGGMLLVLVVFLACQQNFEGIHAPREHPSELSGFEALLDQIHAATGTARKMALVDSFFATRGNTDFPVIEDSICYFVYRGNKRGSVAGDFNGWKPGVDSFVHVDSTDLFYVKKVFPRDARLDYKFVIGNQWLLDPLNPRIIYGGYGPNSELAMPAYVFPREIEYRPEIPHGKQEMFSLHSRIFSNTRKITVYLPPGYEENPAQRYPTLYVQDGGEYLQLASMANVLDNLIAEKRITPIIAVFINPVNRNAEYWLNDQYIAMLTQELIPRIDSTYRTLTAPEHRGIMGASLGGVISLYAGLTAPDYFRFIAGQSSALWIENQKIIALFKTRSLPQLTIYLDWGTFETGMGDIHQELIQILKEKNHRVQAAHFPEGHSWGNWRAHIDNILIYFWGEQ